jgi:hypothetical protein
MITRVVGHPPGQRVRDTRVDLVAIEFEFGQTDIGTTRLLADAHLL